MSEDEIVSRSETKFRVIEVSRDQSGMLFVSALDKRDMFSGEYGPALDIAEAEAEAEVKRYVAEDKAREVAAYCTPFDPNSDRDEVASVIDDDELIAAHSSFDPNSANGILQIVGNLPDPH